MTFSLSYLSPDELLDAGSGIVRIGTAPDGLPLLVSVNLPPQADDLLYQAARAIGLPLTQQGLLGTPLAPVSEALAKVLQAQRFRTLTETDQGNLDVMVLTNSVRNVCGPTLLERLMSPYILAVGPNANPPTILPPGYIPPESATGGLSHPDTRSNPGASIPVPVPPLPGSVAPGGGTGEAPPPTVFRLHNPVVGESLLSIPLKPGDPVIVRRVPDDEGVPNFLFRRRFQSESAAILPEGRFVRYGYAYGDGRQTLDARDSDAYAALRYEAPDAFWFWSVSRNAIAGLVLALAEAIAARQQEDAAVHGDIKPANVLLTQNNGVTPIDSLNLRPGDRSPGLTRGWAAPEQVLGRPVALQTDQYPIGLMLLGLVQGVLYGEEARISIPTGGTQVEYHTLLRDPGVYVDPQTAPVRREAASAWRDLVEQCVRFASEDRFDSMTALCDALRPLVAAETLIGEVEIALSFGQTVIGRDRNGQLRPCWLTH